MKLDTIKDGEEAMEYWDMCRFGIVDFLEGALKDLNEINESLKDVDAQNKVERLIFKLEAQLKH